MDKNPENSSEDNQQGIFSTPDLTVDAEKIAQGTEATNEANRSKIASIFANTDTGRQTQRLNDAMEAQTAPITEDLVIRNEPRGQKKWPIVVAVVVLIAVIGGLTGWIILNRSDIRDNGGSQTDGSTLELSDAYSDFMNYLIAGNKGTGTFTIEGLPEDYSLRNPYSLYAESVIAGLNNDGSDTYLADFVERYTALADAYEKANDGDELDGAIYDYFYEYPNIVKATETDFLQLYLTLGEDATLALINDRYDSTKYSDNLGKYLNAQKAIASYQISLIQLAEKYGCIVDGEVEAGCLDLHASDLDMSVVAAASDAYLTLDDLVLTLRSDAMDAIARLGNQLLLEENK